MNRNLISWAVFFAFVFAAISLSWHDAIFHFNGAKGFGKGMVWLAFLLFTGYSIFCSSRENIFKTVRQIAQFHWGRQIGIDLYLGLTLFFCVIYLHSGIFALMLWLIPTLLFANLATLLYVGIHFDSLISRLIL